MSFKDAKVQRAFASLISFCFLPFSLVFLQFHRNLSIILFRLLYSTPRGENTVGTAGAQIGQNRFRIECPGGGRYGDRELVHGNTSA